MKSRSSDARKLKQLLLEKDSHMLQIMNLEKQANRQIKIAEQKILEEFKDHVARGDFAADLDEKVKQTMEEVQEAQLIKEENKVKEKRHDKRHEQQN